MAAAPPLGQITPYQILSRGIDSKMNASRFWSINQDGVLNADQCQLVNNLIMSTQSTVVDEGEAQRALYAYNKRLGATILATGHVAVRPQSSHSRVNAQLDILKQCLSFLDNDDLFNGLIALALGEFITSRDQ